MSGTVAIVARAALAGKAKLATVRFLGRHALEIYVADVLASAGVRIALDKSPNLRPCALRLRYPPN